VRGPTDLAIATARSVLSRPITTPNRFSAGLTFTVAGYAHPITVYEPAITVTEPVAPTRRKKGMAHQEPPDE
jgi:hypothetical protein